MRKSWIALAILTAINLLNYIDRYVVPPIGESIKASLHNTDAQFGVLATVFLVVYTFTAPFFGSMGDRPNRTRWIALGIVLWSVATACGGLAQTYPQLRAARAFVGIGEAAYSALAPALIADFFPERMRARVFSVFYAAIPIGAALGYIIGGLVDHHYGWRNAFFVVGIPGVVFALAALTIRDPGPEGGRTESPRRAAGQRVGQWWHDALRSYGPLLGNAPYIRTVLGYAAYTFALGGISWWMPTFLIRVRGMPAATANTILGEVVVVTGFVGTFVGGWTADALKKRIPQSYLWVSGVPTLLAAPLAWIAFTAQSNVVCWTAIALAEVLLFLSTGPINSAIVSEVPPAARAAAMAASIVTIHVLGDFWSEGIVGAVSDASSLAHAVLIIPAVIALSGCIWTYAAIRGSQIERQAEASNRAA